VRPLLSRRAALELLGAGVAGYAFPDLAAAAPAAGKTRIARVDVFPVRYPMQGRFKFFEGPEGSPTGRPAVLVRITDDLGGIGWGESVPIPKWSDETLETATGTIEKYLAPELVGRDPADIAGAHAVMNRAIAPAFSTGQPIAKSGVDLALHDLVARRLGLPVSGLWGRTPGAPLALSWTVNPPTPDEIETLIEAGRAKGYRHFNVKVAPDPKVDLELCRRVRSAAPEGFLWADANCGYDLETALAIAPKLADLGVAVLEAPIRPNRIAGYQALARQRALPILMDEGVVSPDELAEFIRLGMLDGVAMKHARCGGLLAARRQIEMLLDAGLMWLGSGLTDPDVSLAATLALFSSFGLARPCALNGPQFLAASVVDTPFTPKDGALAPPTGPGLGVTVNEAKVRAIAEQTGSR
jgi:L-alanine-DL-glutamate epimerase-like enolase superfamily enzyme